MDVSIAAAAVTSEGLGLFEKLCEYNSLHVHAKMFEISASTMLFTGTGTKGSSKQSEKLPHEEIKTYLAF